MSTPYQNPCLGPIPEGHVRYERHDYHYGQQGQVTLTDHTLKDLPEAEAGRWLGGTCSVTWPDGHIECFDLRVTPVRHSPHLGFGTIQRADRPDGERTQCTLSRLQYLVVEYYGPRNVTPEERESFKLHEWD